MNRNNKHFCLLDCTLRDGGYINQGEFSEIAIKYSIKRLFEARTDV